MTVETLPRPTTNPLTVPEPKPSEIVRSWPWKNFCRNTVIERIPDGTIRYCAIGMLAETAGHNWHDGSSAGDTVQRVYGLTREQVGRLVEINDWYGKTYAADYLQSIGK